MPKLNRQTSIFRFPLCLLVLLFAVVHIASAEIKQAMEKNFQDWRPGCKDITGADFPCSPVQDIFSEHSGLFLSGADINHRKNDPALQSS
jgi:hypothetical protein